MAGAANKFWTNFLRFIDDVHNELYRIACERRLV